MDIATQKYRPLSAAKQAYIHKEAKSALAAQFHRIINFVIALSCTLSFAMVQIDSLTRWCILFNLLMLLTAYINSSYNSGGRLYAKYDYHQLSNQLFFK